VRDKLAYAALVFVGAALIAVLFSPVPRPPGTEPVRAAQRVVSAKESERMEVDRDRDEFAKLGSRIDALVKRRQERDQAGAGEDERLAREMVEQELDRRWPEFQARLRVLMMHRERPGN